MYVILVYDIGVKRVGKMLKLCRQYLNWIQNSVFEGNLSKANSLALQKELDVYIRKDKDSVIMFHTREERWMNKDFLGKTDDKTSNFLCGEFIIL